MSTQRRTQADIARLAGVSSSAVSFALNDREGVSPETRERILRIAHDMGWVPNAAARALKDGRASAVGLILTRPAWSLGIEPFFLSFVFGLEGALSDAGSSLLMHIAADQADEIATYRTWWAQRRVDGVVLLDVEVNDSRPSALRALGIPTVAVGNPKHAAGVTAVWTDDGAAIAAATSRFVDLGHTRLARVTEGANMAHTSVRNIAFLDACAQIGLPTPAIIECDGSPAGGSQAMERLMAMPKAPTLVLFDNDVMAVAALGVAQRLGLDVPDEVSLVAFDDSILCTATQPALAALHHDIYAYGVHVASVILRTQAGEEVPDELDSTPTLIERGSLSRAPRTEVADGVL